MGFVLDSAELHALKICAIAVAPQTEGEEAAFLAFCRVLPAYHAFALAAGAAATDN